MQIHICFDDSSNSAMRTAIWSYYGDDLQVNSVELDVTKGDAKPIWEKLQKYLPVYSLFQADRKNSDSDSEVQDPLHAAVKEILQDEGISQTLDHVAEIVEGKLQEVATRTLEKLREMSPDIANTLSPVIPPASSLKWADVFKAVTISGDESIPINKRGSGSKRLILLNFFRAEVERRKDEANAPGIIYAIEEPETSQHSENQKKLINALIALSAESNVQVIITTHSAVLVNALDFKNIRLICADGSRKRVETVRSGQLPFSSLNEVNYIDTTNTIHSNSYVNGQPADLFISTSREVASIIMWTEESVDVAFYVSGFFDESTLIQLAESTRNTNLQFNK